MMEQVMKWYQDLYVSDDLKNKKAETKIDIERGNPVHGIFLITLSGHEHNQMEILPAGNLKFWYVREECPLVIGLAKGKKNARNLVLTIVEDIYQKTGDCNIKQYFASIEK